MFKQKNFAFVSAATVLLMGCDLQSAWAENYSSGQDLTLSSQKVTSASAGRDIDMSDVSVEGRLSAGRNVTCQDCHLDGGVSAGQNVILRQCNPVQSVSSGRDAQLSDARVLSNISSGNNITLRKVSVSMGLSAGNQVIAEGSDIGGLLSLGGNYARLDRSTAGDILFNDVSGSDSFNGLNSSGVQIRMQGVNVSQTGGNASVVVQSSRNGNRRVMIGRSNVLMGNGNSVIRGDGGESVVQVGPGSLSSVNGYTVKATSSQTTVLTPEETIYVNGAKVSGDGPKSYAQYKTTHSEAPTVRGPGWNGNNAAATAKKAAGQSREIVNVLELTNHSVVSGTVTFESGYGKVRVFPGSEFKGKVVNGQIEKVPG